MDRKVFPKVSHAFGDEMFANSSYEMWRVHQISTCEDARAWNRVSETTDRILRGRDRFRLLKIPFGDVNDVTWQNNALFICRDFDAIIFTATYNDDVVLIGAIRKPATKGNGIQYIHS